MQNNIRDIQELQTQAIYDLTVGERQTIAAFVINNERMYGNPRYLEIGVFGGGTIHFLQQYTKTTKFVGVDLFEDFVCSDSNTHGSGTYPMINVQELLGNNVQLIKGDSTIELQQMNESFDFIFIDGNHSYEGTKLDFNNAIKLLTTNGQIAFHNASTHIWPDFDYVKKDGGPWRVVQELKQSKDWILLSEIERLCVFTRRY